MYIVHRYSCMQMILFQSNLFIVFEYLTAVRSASDWIDPRTLAKVGEMTFLITLPALPGAEDNNGNLVLGGCRV